MPDGFFEALVEQSQNLSITFTKQGSISYVSPAIVDVLGYESEQFKQLENFSWIHPEGFQRIKETLTDESISTQVLHSRLLHQQGFWVDCRLLLQRLQWDSRSQDEALSHQHWLVSIHKIDAIAPHTSSYSVKDENPTKPEKSNFLAIMSHELRTPINAINGFSQLLLRERQGLLTREQKDMVQRILTNGKNLLGLINNVLDMSKLEAGHMQLLLEEINIVDLIESTVQEISSLATQRGLNLKTEIALSDPIISNDPMRLRQILVNLLSNAIKFTEEGEIWVVVEEVNFQELWISVQDTGAGIAPGDMAQVFSEFWQVDRIPKHPHQGTGLGLAIAHNLAKMMTGDIHVHSQLGQGTTFRLVIPRYPLQPQPEKIC